MNPFLDKTKLYDGSLSTVTGISRNAHVPNDIKISDESLNKSNGLSKFFFLAIATITIITLTKMKKTGSFHDILDVLTVIYTYHVHIYHGELPNWKQYVHDEPSFEPLVV